MESMFMVVIFIQQYLANSYSKLASNTITIERSLENNFALKANSETRERYWPGSLRFFKVLLKVSDGNKLS